MRKFGKESAAPAEKGADRDDSRGNGWLRNHWCALSLCVIVIAAFLLRTVFAYGISADGDFALSGGSSAQYHLHIVESILNGTYAIGSDAAVNYPVGGLNVIPPLMDYLAAAVAMVLSAMGMTTTEAASAALAAIPPVLGALTCIPVYMVAKEMFDKRVGVVAALIFAFLALPISSTVFSNGNEYALAAFLLAFMTLFVYRMVKAADSEDAGRKAIIVNGLIAGVLLALTALSWNGFRVVVVLLAVAMVLQIVADRFRGRDFKGLLSGYAVAILVGTLVPAAYYIPAGLWDAVFSGPLLIAVVSVVFAFVFMALQSKPWVVTIPALVIAFVVICAVLALAAPGLFDAFIFGNSVYAGSIMEELVSNRVSMSNVSAYYGWLTMWLPICYALYSTYVYLRRDRSATRLFVTVWMFVMFFAVWTNYATAAVVGIVFAVGSAAVIVRVLESAKLREWVHDIKVAGFPGGLRKLIKPLPFASVLIVALLVVVPNFSYAVDAGISNNSDADYYFSGNTQYTIRDGDSYPIGDVWDTFEDTPKDGALVTWIDYAYDSVAQGGFESVTDAYGGGASAASQIYLAEGASGSVAAMMLRVMMSNDIDDFASAFSGNSDVYQTVRGYIQDPSSAKDEIVANPSVYGNVRSDITDENAVYLASINAMLEDMSGSEIMEAYDRVCDISGDRISYVLVDGSLLPLQYGDGSYFSTMAYFADYSVDGYGAATQYYSYNTYYGYTTYTEAMYDTFLWKAMIGPSASEAGYSSSYSYLVALATSDGSVKAHPGWGLAGYEVAYWNVQYNPDDNATVSSDGWEYMTIEAALTLQENQGGLINYLSSIIMLEYTGVSEGTSVHGYVTSGDARVDGATVSVYQYDESYGGYVLFSEAQTIDGEYEVLVPSGDYRLTVSMGGLQLYSFASGSFAQTIDVGTASISGTVMAGENVYDSDALELKLTGDASEHSIPVTEGTFSIDSVMPGTYTYRLYNSAGTAVGSGSITVYPGSNVGVEVSATTYNITATVNDPYGNSVQSGFAYAINTTTGVQFSAEIENGRAVIAVVPGTYNIYVGGGYVSMHTSTVTISSSNRTATVSTYESETVTVSGAPSTGLTVSAGTFSTVTYVQDGQTRFDIPVGLATDNMLYTLYGVDGSRVYTGVYTGTTASVSGADAYIVSGQLKDGSSGEEGTVIFIDGNNGYYSVATDSEGNYNIMLPAGTYTVYAHNGSNQVHFGTYTVTANGDNDMGDVDLDDGRRVYITLRYDRGTSQSNAYLPFALGVIQFTYNDVQYTLYSMTNTSGVVNFYIPDNVAAVIAINNLEGQLDNDSFYCTELRDDVSSGTSNSSNPITIQVYDSEDPDENYVKPQDVTIPYDMTVHYYEDDDDVENEYTAGQTVELRPGQYTVTIDGSSGHYFNGTAYIYPGQTEFTRMDVDEVATVNITRGESDAVTVRTDGGSYHAFQGGYYVEVGYEYYFTSTRNVTVDGSEVTNIAYGYVDATEGMAAQTIDMTAGSRQMSVTGYTGVNGSGTLTVDYTANGRDVKVEFTITNGAYTMTLPSDVTSVTANAEVTRTISSQTYYFANSEPVTFSGMTDGAVRNLAVVSTDAPESEDEPGFTASVSGESFSDGTGSLVVTIENNTDAEKTYFVSAGSAWTLDRAYTVNVGAGSTGTVQVSGTYDANLVAPGQDGFTVIVQDVNGTDSQTIDVTGGASSTGGSVEVLTSDPDDRRTYNDMVSASEYMYAITIVNGDAASKAVTVNFTVPGGWYATVMNEDGTVIGSVGDEFTVAGLETTVLYVKMMPVQASESMTVPSINASVSVDGSSSTVSLTPTAVEVDAGDMTVSGNGSLDERSGVPMGIWFLVVVMILLIVAVFWLASKRGVFSR